MSALSGQRILLGVSGGIAVYKAADLVRRLQDAGAEVRVAMTEGPAEKDRPAKGGSVIRRSARSRMAGRNSNSW